MSERPTCELSQVEPITLSMGFTESHVRAYGLSLCGDSASVVVVAKGCDVLKLFGTTADGTNLSTYTYDDNGNLTVMAEIASPAHGRGEGRRRWVEATATRLTRRQEKICDTPNRQASSGVE